MVLVDTSVWINHLRASSAALVDALNHGVVLIHPMVIGELAVGSIADRTEFVTLLGALPAVAEARADEVLHMVEHRQLYGRGLGWVDVNLLASTLITDGATLWTADKRLAAAAVELSIGYS